MTDSQQQEPRDPETRDEWRVAVAMAHAWLKVHAAILYGFITGDPDDINVERCEEIIERGREQGIEATEEEIDGAIMAIAAGPES